MIIKIDKNFIGAETDHYHAIYNHFKVLQSQLEENFILGLSINVASFQLFQKNFRIYHRVKENKEG